MPLLFCGAPNMLDQYFLQGVLTVFQPDRESRTLLSDNSTYKTVRGSAPKRRGVFVLALLVAVFLPSACAPPESNGITNSSPPPSPPKPPPIPLPPPPSPLKRITGRAFNGNTITYYTLDTAARAALTPQSIGITDIPGDVEYTIEQVGTSGQVGWIADTSGIQPNEANPNTLDIPQGTTGFFTVQVNAKNAKGNAVMQSKKVLIAAGRIDVGAKIAIPDAPTLGTPAPKKENITMNAANRKVRITVLEAGTTFTVVPPPQFPAEAPKYTLTYSAEGVGDNNIVKAIDQATGELTQGDVGSGDAIAAIKARTADITVKVTAEAVGPYPALDTTLFTVEHYRWMRVDTLYNHTLAINSRGELYAWGDNGNGQLGIGKTTDTELSPQRVGSDSDWEAIRAGEDHSLALKSDGTLYSWGKNDRGQLGIGSTGSQTTPRQVGNAGDWKAIAAGGNHSLALKSDGTLYAWGANHSGQLGNGENGANFNDKSKDKTAPIQIGTDRDWQTIIAGRFYSLALKTDNTLNAWGYNVRGQLGLGDTTSRNEPTKVGSGTDWKAVSGAAWSTHAIKTDDNTLYAWGHNARGQLGLGDTTSRNRPTPISAGWKAVAVGRSHSLGIKDDDTLYAWGYNVVGQLGLGDAVNRNRPAKVGSDTDWKAVDGGRVSSFALKSNGTLYAMGRSVVLGIGTDTPPRRRSPTLVPHP